MAEIIDVLFIGWCVLALGAYILGQLLEKQLEARRVAGEKSSLRRLEATDLDSFWSPSGAQANRNSLNYNGHQAAAHRDSYEIKASNTHHHVSSAYANSNQQQHYGAPNSSYDSSYPAQANSSQADHMQSSTTAGATYSSGAPHYGAATSGQEAGNYFGGRFDEPNMSQRSPAGPLSSSERAHLEASNVTSGTIPTASGFNADCVEWVNSILYLFFTQAHKYAPIIGENIYRSLNEKLSNITSSSSDHSDLLIEFESINGELSSQPELTNIRTECESDKSISATCKIYNKRISFTLLIKRLLGSPHERLTSASFAADELSQRYELTLENLEGKLKSVAMLADKLIVIQFLEKPDTKILLRQLANPSNLFGSSTPSQQELISEDLLVQMILQTLTQVVVDLYFGDDLDFPQFAPKHQHQQASAYSNYKHKINTLTRALKHDLFGSSSSEQLAKERKVFAKIIRAKNINYNQNVTCLMELDAPKQQAISSTKQGSSPFWDEHFLFTANENSRELTFELWDSLNSLALEQAQSQAAASSPTSSLKRKQQQQQQQQQQQSASGSGKLAAAGWRWNKLELAGSSGKFLGLARVSMDELRQNPVQKLSLTLEPALNTAPNDLSNSVGGELQLELLFLEHSASSGAHQQPPTGGAASANHASQLHKANSLSSLAYQQGDIVSIDRKLTPSGFVITTTTITKQQQQPAQQQAGGKQTGGSGHFDQLLVRNQSPAGSSSMATERSFDDLNLDGASGSGVFGARGQQLDRRSEGVPAGGAESPLASGRLSRSRSRSRSLLRAIKKRFSFSRTRSRSLGGDSSPAGLSASQPGTPLADRLEADYEPGGRSRASSEASAAPALDSGSGRAKSVPASRDPCEVPTIVINKGRLSDTASAFTFTHPKSQLVIEVLEPRLRDDGAGNTSRRPIYRYYAIAESAGDKRKWRKRGTKLHLFNEHQFVASHMASSSTCHLCGRLFSRRPGKQGYKCRNCHLLLHKQCHVKVDHNCPYAKREGLPLEYIDAEPPANLVEEIMESNRRQQQQQAGEPADLVLSGGSGGGGSISSSARNDPYQQQQQLQTTRSGTRARPSNLRMGKSSSMDVDDR